MLFPFEFGVFLMCNSFAFSPLFLEWPFLIDWSLVLFLCLVIIRNKYVLGMALFDDLVLFPLFGNYKE